ncbi:Lipid droplet localized protein [Eumeta japonica]|uniref:Lipid droplet localized protein n=1 Tax=Eumeta variegata TaxID=151549 RepID=A0A4C1WR60_EUMVA|nr:Lipid droplet localized protein [Eumeta japonica]
MSRLDVVIFGATGFTGKHALMETIRISKSIPLTWGIAGRSQRKLQSLIEDVSKKMDENLLSARIIVADVNNQQSLKEMTAQAKVIANCCGPFRLYGEQVVKACIETKTHYVDVSGEPQFMETMQLVYDAAARDAGVYVVSACGFDSVPNDMGVVFLQQNFGGSPVRHLVLADSASLFGRRRFGDFSRERSAARRPLVRRRDVPEQFMWALISEVEHPAGNAPDEFLYGLDIEVASDNGEFGPERQVRSEHWAQYAPRGSALVDSLFHLSGHAHGAVNLYAYFKPTSRGVPRRSPIQVLTAPDAA